MSAAAQKIARRAGWFYFGIIFSSILSLVLLGGQYTVMGDQPATAAKMLDQVGYVRLNAAYEALMFSAVIALAVLLFSLTKAIDPVLARMALLLRVAEALLGYLGIVLTLGVLSVGPAEAATTDSSLPVLLLELKDLTYKILMICISLGTILFFYLFQRAKYIPSVLTLWGIVGFSLMLLSSLLQLLDVPFGVLLNGIAAALAISFEFVVGLWLIVKGGRVGPEKEA